MKRALAHIALIILVCFFAIGARGQQVYQFSQYLQNLYILNSATAGLHDYTEVNLSYRNQWVGITNSPTTYYVSVTQPIGKRIEINPQNSSVRISSPAAYTSIQRKSYHAIGGYAARDSYGPYGLTMAGLSYTFHLPIAKQLSVAFSPSVGYTSVTFDQSKAVVEFSGDPTYMNYVSTRAASSLMDINLAFWMYHPKFFVGYSTDQLVQDRLKLSNQITLEEIKAHHNLIAGYHYRINRNMTLTPSVLVKYVGQAPISADLNVRLDYQDRFWGGISFRNSNSLVGMAGIHLSNTLRFGYAFDFTLSSIQTNNIGSHEVMLGLNLFNKEKAIF
ncbi:MAG: type IX secretion system membrane protein PorP/SprF [Cryomorphaceae bacterium]